MFARVTEYNIRPEKLHEMRAFFNDEVLPLLQRQSGFVDAIAVVNERSVPMSGVTISMWKTQQDIEKYERETAPRIIQRLMPHLLDPPKARVYEVEHSTFHRIASGKAA